MVDQYLTIILLLQNICSRYCAVTLQQPSAIAAVVGSTVNLSCHLQLGTEKVNRLNLYWLIQMFNTTVKKYVYPDKTDETIISKNSVWLSKPDHNTDMSLTISNIRLPYTGTYVCHTSLLFNSESKTSTGSGTYLLVYENLGTFINGSDIICESAVQEVEDVKLIWEFEGGKYGNVVHSQLPNSSQSYWITNRLPNGTTLCQARRNVIFTCLLQYMGKSLLNQSIEITCTGGSNGSSLLGEPKASHPMLLYSLILGNSLVILMIVIVIFLWMKKRWHKRRNEISVSYTNVPNISNIGNMKPKYKS